MGRIEKPWGYEDQVLCTQVEGGGERGMLGIRKLVLNADEMTSYAKHEHQADIIYLEKGSATLRIDDNLEELDKEDAKVVRPGQNHQIQNIDSQVVEILEISFPYKPDDIERVEDPYSEER